MVFYFSATGNSKYVADRIAAATGDKTYLLPTASNTRIFPLMNRTKLWEL